MKKRITLLRFFIETIKPFKGLFASIIFCSGISSLSVYGFFWSVKYLIDALAECAVDMSKINNVYKCTMITLSAGDSL